MSRSTCPKSTSNSTQRWQKNRFTNQRRTEGLAERQIKNIGRSHLDHVAAAVVGRELFSPRCRWFVAVATFVVLCAWNIIRYVDGPLVPIKCLVDADSQRCNLREHCSLMPMWQQAGDALSDVYGSFSLETLAEQDKNSDRTLNYVI